MLCYPMQTAIDIFGYVYSIVYFNSAFIKQANRCMYLFTILTDVISYYSMGLNSLYK